MSPRGRPAERVLSWGLLGTARINRSLIPPLRASSRNRLLAVASRTAERAQSYAREWDIPRAHPDYEALLADPEVDVVYIPLPNALHAEWTVRAAKAGKHVLCEKPLVLSGEEMARVETAAKEAGVVVTEAFMYRHHPQTERIRALVREGAVGRLGLVRGCFTFELTRPQDVRLDPGLGGGSLWDVGCYPVSLARFVVGAEPVEVFGWQRSGPSGVDEVFSGQMRFPGDVLAQFDCGFRSPFRAEMEFVGTEGVLRVPWPFRPGEDASVMLTRRNGETETIPTGGGDRYALEVEDLADSVLKGMAPRVSLVESRGNMVALVALLRSAREGRPVPVG
jgi:xylose dehydrogenase (NAD/NADP)